MKNFLLLFCLVIFVGAKAHAQSRATTCTPVGAAINTAWLKSFKLTVDASPSAGAIIQNLVVNANSPYAADLRKFIKSSDTSLPSANYHPQKASRFEGFTLYNNFSLSRSVFGFELHLRDFNGQPGYWAAYAGFRTTDGVFQTSMYDCR